MWCFCELVVVVCWDRRTPPQAINQPHFQRAHRHRRSGSAGTYGPDVASEVAVITWISGPDRVAAGEAFALVVRVTDFFDQAVGLTNTSASATATSTGTDFVTVTGTFYKGG